jgi:hypothetical protein
VDLREGIREQRKPPRDRSKGIREASKGIRELRKGIKEKVVRLSCFTRFGRFWGGEGILEF